MAEQVRLCGRDELGPGEARRFDVNGHRIALVRVDDSFRAIGDECSHANFSLSDGEVYAEDCEIECPAHGSTFSLDTGEAICLPATVAVPVYPVTLEGDDVMVELS